MRGAWSRIAILVAGIGFLAACPPNKPPVQHPDADAASAPVPVVHADCGAAATHYAGVCGTADAMVTAGLCQAQVLNNSGYSDCLMKATSCDDGTACDGSTNVSSGKKPVIGR